MLTFFLGPPSIVTHEASYELISATLMLTFPTLDLFWCTIISIILSLDVTGILMSRDEARVLRVKKSVFTTDMYNIIDWDYEINAE